MLEPMLEVRLFLVKEGNCMCEEEDDNFFFETKSNSQLWLGWFENLLILSVIAPFLQK